VTAAQKTARINRAEVREETMPLNSVPGVAASTGTAG
jgi:hypothetical protein